MITIAGQAQKPLYLYPVLITCLFYLFTGAMLLQLGYAYWFFSHVFRLPVHKDVPEEALQPVSVIICARNEAANLRVHLPRILEQHYPSFEVVVVNDASEDDTLTVLEEFSAVYQHLRFITISRQTRRTLKGKKFALNAGVAAARFQSLLFTDADCVPASEQWIRLMVAPLSAGKEISLGYGGHIRGAGLLNAFVRWETINTFLQYATYALAGKPYMAVGRNLACVREAFMAAKDFRAWNKLPSGDDDLLMQAYATSSNTAVVADARSFTWSKAPETWGQWIRQKQRHVSTGKYYKKEVMVLVGLYACIHALVWLLFPVLMIVHDASVVIWLMAARCLIFWALWMFAARRLGDRGLAGYTPLFDPGWMIYNFAVSPYVVWKNKQQWK